MTPKKIAIIGTHGTGKTTLTYLLAAESKKLGRNARVINETARSCPFPLNDGFTIDGANWIVTTQIQKELNAKAAKTELIICDRSSIDPIMYLDAGNHKIYQYEKLFRYAEDWLKTYDKIVFVKQDGSKPKNDGIRSTDRQFQISVEEKFNDFLRYGIVNIKFLHTMHSKSIFEKDPSFFYKEILGDT